jgi:hypothetical protein
MLFAAQAIRLALALILQHAVLRCPPGVRVSRLTRGNIMHARYGLPMRVLPPGTPPGPRSRVGGDVHDLVALTP